MRLSINRRGHWLLRLRLFGTDPVDRFSLVRVASHQVVVREMPEIL